MNRSRIFMGFIALCEHNSLKKLPKGTEPVQIKVTAPRSGAIQYMLTVLPLTVTLGFTNTNIISATQVTAHTVKTVIIFPPEYKKLANINQPLKIVAQTEQIVKLIGKFLCFI